MDTSSLFELVLQTEKQKTLTLFLVDMGALLPTEDENRFKIAENTMWSSAIGITELAMTYRRREKDKENFKFIPHAFSSLRYICREVQFILPCQTILHYFNKIPKCELKSLDTIHVSTLLLGGTFKDVVTHDTNMARYLRTYHGHEGIKVHSP